MNSVRLSLIALFALAIVTTFFMETCHAQPPYTLCITRCSSDLILCWDSCPKDSNYTTCRDGCIDVYNQCTPTCPKE